MRRQRRSYHNKDSNSRKVAMICFTTTISIAIGSSGAMGKCCIVILSLTIDTHKTFRYHPLPVNTLNKS